MTSTGTTATTEYVERYEAAMAPARRAFATDPAVRAIQDRSTGPDRMEGFLIWFCGLGMAMTEPVEGWIRRAGEACDRLGTEPLTTLGRALQSHANAEADHHLLMEADLHKLCARRAAAGRGEIDPAAVLGAAWPAATLRYRQLHEDVIAGTAPYAQIAIENEIEMLSVEIGPGLLDNAEALLGADVLAELTFLTDHVELDSGHTVFNRRQMARFLDEQPDALDDLVPAGTAALDAYREFVGECLARGSA